MKNIKLNMVLLSVFSTNLFAWEVNTHQAITRCAITEECVQNKDVKADSVPLNLKNFVKETSMGDKNYLSAQYQDYGTTYINYINKGTFDKDEDDARWTTTVNNRGSYIDMIEAGSILEDAVWNDAIIVDGRFNNHFYDPQINTREECTKEAIALQAIAPKSSSIYLLMISYMVGDKALCVGYGDRTDAVQWAIKGDQFKFGSEDDVRTNNYSYGKALEYYKESFSSETKTKREENQAKMFVSLGHLLHLLQDMHVPAHVRNDSHADDDELEKWARAEGGFRIQNGVIDMNSNLRKVAYLFDSKNLVKSNSLSTARDFFVKEATFTGNNFLSLGHDIGVDTDTLFDEIHTNPSRNTCDSVQVSVKKNFLGSIYTNYINTRGNYVPSLVKGDINFKTLVIETGGDYEMSISNNNKPITDNALNLIPRAVGASKGFLNYFFRGRMELREENGVFSIKNVSDKTLVATPETVTFKKGGVFTIYYDDSTDDNKRKMLYTFELKENLPSGSEIKIPLSQLSQKYEEVKTVLTTDFTLIYEGDIGEEKGISVVKKLTTSSVKVETTSATDSITLKWNSVLNATGYTICKSESEITNGDECVKNGGKLLTTSKTEIKITDELKENTTYYFMVKENKEDLWSKQVSAELTPYLLFMLPANATLDGYKLTATKGDTISFSSSNSYFSEYIKESNARSDEDVTYTLWYIDGETGKRTSVVLTLDEESETFSFVMPSSSITPQNILNNIDRSIGFPLVWESKDAPNPDNTPPTANAGKDKKNVSIDAEVHLSGKDSNDTEGDPLTYLWSFVSKPNDSSATLSDATIVNPTFTADEHGTYTIQLVVNDGFSNSSPDTVVIETDEEAPVKEVNPTSCTPEFD